MKKIIAFLMFSILSVSSYSSPRFEADYGFSKEFELTISPSFSDSSVYTLVSYEGKRILAKRVFASGYQKWSDVKSETHIELPEDSYENLKKLLDDALNFKIKDDVLVEDGVIWELETSRYQWLKIRISTPDYETESRGYQGLLKLGAFVQAQFP